MDSRLFWLALGGFAGGLEGFLIGSLLPGISADLGITVGVAGLAVTAYALAHGFGTPVLAAIFGGVHRHRLLAGAELAFASAAILIALAPHFVWLVLARIVLAMGAGLYSATAMATAIAVSPPENRGRAIGIVVAGQSLAVLVGVPTGAWVAANYGWRPAYLAIAMLGLAAAAAMYLRLPRGIAGDTRTIRERVSALRIPGIPLALLTTAVFMISAYLPVI
jgi:predicted MFS family arabinose efflux permease